MRVRLELAAVSMPEFDVEEAVARFFPRSTDYDHVAARRLIDWLDSCGYTIVAHSAIKAQPLQPQREGARIGAPASRPLFEDAL